MASQPFHGQLPLLTRLRTTEKPLLGRHLDRMRDVREAVPGPALRDPGRERRLAALEQPLGLHGNLPTANV